jgi:hypothetical protein
MTGASVEALTFASVGSPPPSLGTTALVFSGGGGSGAAGYVTVGVGPTYSFYLFAPGQGYTSNPTCYSIAGDGTRINVNAFIGTQSVASVTKTAGGSSYTAPPDAIIVPPDGLGFGAELVTTEAGGAMATIALVPSAVVAINITTPGIYTAAAGTYALIFTGGGGSGATGTAVLALDPTGQTTDIICTEVFLTAGGTDYTSSPTVTVNAAVTTQATFLALTASQGAGYDTKASVVIGSGSGATAMAHVWPFIVSSIAAYAFTTIAVFQGRVWLGGGQLLTWTGTGATYGNVAYDDFLSADASGALIISDADLIHAITALRSLNNYLWIMGDQSVKQIGNLSLNSAGDVTLFTILTLSSDQGTIYKKSCISYNRVFLFANTNGIYGVFGSSVQKLSGDMDGIWKLIDFSQMPQGALADINAIHNAVFLIRYEELIAAGYILDNEGGYLLTDQGNRIIATPATSVTRSIMVAFDGTRWFVLSQGDSLTAIATSASLTTGQNSLYGSSGPDVTNLLAAPTPVAFKIQTALTHHGNAVQGKKVIRAGFTSQIGADSSVTMTVDTEAGLGLPLTMDIETGVSLVGGSNDANNDPVGASGVYLGLTITGTLAAFTMTNLILETQETSLWKGA